MFNAFYGIKQEAFRDTIFSRPPILFSLILCLDQKPDAAFVGLEDKMFSIDAEFRDEQTGYDELYKFRESVSASTQRLSSRRVREAFLHQRL